MLWFFATGLASFCTGFSNYFAVAPPQLLPPSDNVEFSDIEYYCHWLLDVHFPELQPKLVVFNITEDCGPKRLSYYSEVVKRVTQYQEQRGNYVLLVCPGVSSAILGRLVVVFFRVQFYRSSWN